MNERPEDMLLSRRSFVTGISALACGGGLQVLAAAPPHFVGRVLAEWLPDGRNMRLEEPFEYVDAGGRRWPVPKGISVDGASIPQVFWSIIGGPFEVFTVLRR
jgi:hypothetical protein